MSAASSARHHAGASEQCLLSSRRRGCVQPRERRQRVCSETSQPSSLREKMARRRVSECAKRGDEARLALSTGWHGLPLVVDSRAEPRLEARLHRLNDLATVNLVRLAAVGGAGLVAGPVWRHQLHRLRHHCRGPVFPRLPPSWLAGWRRWQAYHALRHVSFTLHLRSISSLADCWGFGAIPNPTLLGATHPPCAAGPAAKLRPLALRWRRLAKLRQLKRLRSAARWRQHIGSLRRPSTRCPGHAQGPAVGKLMVGVATAVACACRTQPETHPTPNLPSSPGADGPGGGYRTRSNLVATVRACVPRIGTCWATRATRRGACAPRPADPLGRARGGDATREGERRGRIDSRLPRQGIKQPRMPLGMPQLGHSADEWSRAGASRPSDKGTRAARGLITMLARCTY